jgi:hypothetical protein
MSTWLYSFNVVWLKSGSSVSILLLFLSLPLLGGPSVGLISKFYIFFVIFIEDWLFALKLNGFTCPSVLVLPVYESVDCGGPTCATCTLISGYWWARAPPYRSVGRLYWFELPGGW